MSFRILSYFMHERTTSCCFIPFCLFRKASFNVSHTNSLYVDPRPVCSAPKSWPLVSPSSALYAERRS